MCVGGGVIGRFVGVEIDGKFDRIIEIGSGLLGINYVEIVPVDQCAMKCGWSSVKVGDHLCQPSIQLVNNADVVDSTYAATCGSWNRGGNVGLPVCHDNI